MKEFLSDMTSGDALNPQQEEAVNAIDGPVLVSAAAGTGKTKVLTVRFSRIIEQEKAHPWNILAVTFTNKAANEMKERVSSVVSVPVNNLWIGTFHSISLRILRKHHALCDRTASFSVIDTGDQLSIVRKILKSLGMEKKVSPQVVVARINDIKQGMFGFKPNLIDAETMKIYNEYKSNIKSMDAFDFADLINEAIFLFKKYPEILDEYSNQFKYILVDEYQDVNNVQHEWIKMLSGAHGNVCCVGDDDQSIYGWRGANIENILRFGDDFPNAKIIRLEQNYRSTAHILSAASGVISHNKRRYGKVLKTDNGTGEKVYVYGLSDSGDEAKFISRRAEELNKSGKAFSSMAILVRATFQTREFEERFMMDGVPYKIVGNSRFYERQEVKDFLAYIRVIFSSYDNVAFERVLCAPRRGIGDATIEALYAVASQSSASLYNAAEIAIGDKSDVEGIRNSTKIRLRTLISSIKRWQDMAGKKTPIEVAENILAESGLVEMWAEQDNPKHGTKLDNVRDLIKTMEKFSSIREFLEHTSLLLETGEDSVSDSISVMTLHAAKGLEFDVVFLPGWEEGVFPNMRCIEELGNKGLEEERRLAYVGITRARQKAIICFCWSRRLPQGWTSSSPSRFIEEIPAENVIISLNQQYQQSVQQKERGQGLSYEWANMFGKKSYKEYCASSQPEKLNNGYKEEKLERYTRKSAFSVGQRVRHPLFGKGSVCSSSADTVFVEFENGMAKRISAGFLVKE
ncbi:ATP-dependent helicase [Candidatus Hydrogenosomobacter endosymbioticus]|uniref:DNA 3'-5' helicase n=1 Tax=Candidatus Hydrogenosomobacter endosymbioticus TaxID=2558174 RepID=A0ABN6L497_9PROT|nr:UvrD-helicase domain-containing protein [Candidatus Hydrogenosomobacter endosymbioticus]BDB96417.1 DNA helicase [Candidatus Hydrogenosomobacter endosymbioticus]